MTTIGRVDFVVGLDGTTLPRRAFVVGHQIGRSISSGIDQELRARFAALGVNMQKQLGVLGERGGLVLANSLGRQLETRLGPRLRSFFDGVGGMMDDVDFDRWGDDLGELIVVVREVDSGFNRLAITAGTASAEAERSRTFWQRLDDSLNSMLPDVRNLDLGFARLADRVGTFNSRIRETIAQGGGIRGFFRELVRVTDEADDSGKTLLERWKAIPHGARQFAFYTALFANLAESIAVLGSAAGAGLLTLGGAATFAGIGLTAAIVGFTGLNKELEDLPPEVRPAVEALRGLGDQFGDLRRQLQVRTLQNLTPAIESLRSSVRELTPEFAALGDVTSGLVTTLAERLAPGTKNFERLRTVIRSSGPVFDRLMRITGRFGEALLTAFSSPALLRSVNEMLDWLGGLADGFLAFTESDQLSVWLGRASAVFGSLGRLLEATGTMLNNLVDAEAVGRLTGFLSNLTGFMPSLERLLSMLGEFDLFGLIAQMLNEFGEALAPLAGPMEALAAGLNDVVQSGIQTLAPILEDVALALAPLVQGLADFIAANPQAVADALLAIAGGALVLKGAQGLAGLAGVVTTNLGGLGTAVKENDWKTIGSKLGKGGAASFLPALVTGLFTGEGGAGATIATATIAGLSVGGFPGMVAGALIGSIVSAFTDPGSWENGAQQIATFFSEGLGGILDPSAWSNGWEQIKEFNRIASDEIGAAFETSWSDWGAKFQNGRDQINQGVGTWWGQLMTAFGNGGAQLGAAWSGAWSAIFAQGQALWSGIAAGVSGWWSGLMGAFANGAAQIGAAWNGFWSGLAGIVASVWGGIVSIVSGAVNTVIGIINGMIAKINGALSTVRTLTGGLVNLSIPNLPKMASGGVLYGPTRVVAGEAGPEAIVPLNRPLSQVDPAVRGLSAIAQGKGGYGGAVPAGKQIVNNIAEGAIQVIGVADGRLAAESALDRLALGVGS